MRFKLSFGGDLRSHLFQLNALKKRTFRTCIKFVTHPEFGPQCLSSLFHMPESEKLTTMTLLSLDTVNEILSGLAEWLPELNIIPVYDKA